MTDFFYGIQIGTFEELINIFANEIKAYFKEQAPYNLHEPSEFDDNEWDQDVKDFDQFLKPLFQLIGASRHDLFPQVERSIDRNNLPIIDIIDEWFQSLGYIHWYEEKRNYDPRDHVWVIGFRVESIKCRHFTIDEANNIYTENLGDCGHQLDILCQNHPGLSKYRHRATLVIFPQGFNSFW